MHRNKIEAEILGIEGKLSEGFVPEIYLYDENMYALSMEDISAYKNLRTEMAAGKTFPKLADDIATFMADTLLPTTDLIMNRAEKKEKVKLFTNPEFSMVLVKLTLIRLSLLAQKQSRDVTSSWIRTWIS